MVQMDIYISGKRRTSQLITIRNHVSGLDAACLGFGVASTQQRFKRVNLSGRGAAGGGRRPTSFFLGFGCPREFWSSERAGGCSRGISYHGREGV